MNNFEEVEFKEAMDAYKKGKEVRMLINDILFSFKEGMLIHAKDLLEIEWYVGSEEDV